MKYLLIGLVALIWGVILYKVIRGLAGDDPPPVVTKVKPPQPEDTLTRYVLTTLQYPDPFSNELITEEEEVTGASVPGQTKVPAANPLPAPVVAAAPPPTPPPAIKYSGYIYNPQTKKRTAMISVNGRSMTVGVNERIDDKITVLEITDQKIVVRIEGRKMDVAIGG
ncbi:general secretion pathway protein GspB [Niabella drilacis]|uniref:Type IV pilus biogenesis n=1 Tax=Niabella drilacis (strain DSM 25811 / CCM 8410 / CCUG 62505 / LMG 26954 / E90) TaxID=1285928 RepID=A0A1G6UNZ4_NIADE|nr:general secretion pathway protein GspB [Niabella drilacis]SDD43011.1 Type IV pilus biogenesis [Niabella drilacis]